MSMPTGLERALQKNNDDVFRWVNVDVLPEMPIAAKAPCGSGVESVAHAGHQNSHNLAVVPLSMTLENLPRPSSLLARFVDRQPTPVQEKKTEATVVA